MAEETAGMVAEDDLDLVAARWVEQVSAHRKAQGMFGSIYTHVVHSPSGSEVHLTEETTFKTSSVPEGTDLVKFVLEWIATQSFRRNGSGSTGALKLEITDRDGRNVMARITETTVVSASRGAKSSKRSVDRPRKA